MVKISTSPPHFFGLGLVMFLVGAALLVQQVYFLFVWQMIAMLPTASGAALTGVGGLMMLNSWNDSSSRQLQQIAPAVQQLQEENQRRRQAENELSAEEFDQRFADLE